MKKTLITLSILPCLVLIGVLSFAIFLKLNPQPESKIVSKVTEEEKEINNLKEEILGLDDFDLEDIENLQSDLSDIDLTGI